MRKEFYVAIAGLLISWHSLAGCAPQKKEDAEKPVPGDAKTEQPELKEPAATDVEGLYQYAQALEQKGDEKQALSYYLQTIQQDPNHLKAHIALAQLYMKFNRIEEAKVAYENILSLEREHPFVSRYKEAKLKYYSARNIAQNEEYRRALELLNQAPAQTPLDQEIAQVREEWEEKLTSDSNKQKSDEIIQQASLLAYKGKYAEAIQLIKTAPDSDKHEGIQLKIAHWEKAIQDNANKLNPIGPKYDTTNTHPDTVPSPKVPDNPDSETASYETRYVLGDGVNMRSTPALAGTSLARLPRGSSVLLLADRTVSANGYQWSKIRISSGETGWVAATYLGTSLASAPPATTSPPPATTAPTPQYRFIKKDKVNVRLQPSLHSSIVAMTSKGERVRLLSTQAVNKHSHAWNHVQLSSGKQGWLASEFLAAAKPTGEAKPKTHVVNGDNVNIRKMATLRSAVIHVAKEGTRLKVLGSGEIESDGYKWLKVALPDGRVGWVVSDFVRR